MIAAGTVVEVGQLEDEAGALGFVIRRESGEFITVKGLTPDETRVAAALFLKVAKVTLTPSTGDEKSFWDRPE